MEKERQMLEDYMNDKAVRKFLNLILTCTYQESAKSAKASEEARKKGNDLLLSYKKHDAEMHKTIFSHYCESIALAPIDSQELALAYGNRSYLLLHMHKYEDCIKDIDRALKLKLSDVLKAKLLCRKAECLKRLGSPIFSSVLEMVQSLTEKVDSKDRIKLLKMIDAVKLLAVDTTKIESSGSEKKRINHYKLPLTDDYSSRISIEYNEKYGRHLVAAKDYKPGDIIFVEEMYVSAFDEELNMTLLSCDHCLQPVWSSIPCSYCSWAMYCSDSCREEAWSDYHDIECSLISYIKQWHHLAWTRAIMSVRILIKGIKETGSIANLKKEIESLDQRPGVPFKDFLKNGGVGINSIKNVYSLAAYFPPEYFRSSSLTFPLILISLTKYSKLKDNFNVKNVKDLLVDETIMFLGSFLIKITEVHSCNCYGTGHDVFKFTRKESDVTHYDSKRCLSILFSLMSHNCFPTAEWCCFNKNKLLVFATRPITKNSQIFINYGFSIDDYIPSVRQEKLLDKYNFKCSCQACVEAWPSMMEDKVLNKDKLKHDIENYILNKILEVLRKGQKVDKTHIETLSLLITENDRGKPPSCRFWSIIDLLLHIFAVMYAPKSLVFEKCD